MDFLPETFNHWLLNYGALALFGLLALGIIALPIPEETLLVFSGILIHEGTFSFLPTLLAAFLGSVVGITGSYMIGITGGLYIIQKYGGYIGLTESKMSQAHNWFERYGKWVLFIGYFVPGLRHFTGIFAGVSSLKYAHFAQYAYIGAFCWVLLFLSIGYFFGNYHKVFFELIESNVELVLTSALFIVLGFIFIKSKRASKP